MDAKNEITPEMQDTLMEILKLIYPPSDLKKITKDVIQEGLKLLGESIIKSKRDTLESWNIELERLKAARHNLTKAVNIAAGPNQKPGQIKASARKAWFKICDDYAGHTTEIAPRAQEKAAAILIDAIFELADITNPIEKALVSVGFFEEEDPFAKAETVFDALNRGLATSVTLPGSVEYPLSPKEEEIQEQPKQKAKRAPRISDEEKARRKERSRLDKAANRATRKSKAKENPQEHDELTQATAPIETNDEKLARLKDEFELAVMDVDYAREELTKTIKASEDTMNTVSDLTDLESLDADHKTHINSMLLAAKRLNNPEALDPESDKSEQIEELSRLIEQFKDAAQVLRAQKAVEEEYPNHLWAAYNKQQAHASVADGLEHS